MNRIDLFELHGNTKLAGDQPSLRHVHFPSPNLYCEFHWKRVTHQPSTRCRTILCFLISHPTAFSVNLS